MTHETQKLLEFVRQLPKGFAYTPVYAKGRIFGKHNDVSTGKAPYERAHHAVLDPADVALLIEKRPDDFAAVGVFTGIRSDGLVILDVDANLAALKSKWGDTLEGAPVVTSTKPNAAKYLFRVPVDQRSKVKGISGKVSKAGYEVLWGGQGLIAGVYPGSTDGTGPAGVYTLRGDLNAVPDAPEWLLAEMRAAKQRTEPEQGLIKNKKGLNFEGRSEDELHALVADCLSVLPHLGRGTEDFWWSIGAMIAEVLPNDRGLMLWSHWSAEDPAFEDDWANGDPCAAKWPHILNRVGRPGNKGLGSLIYLADEYDPRRERFQESSRKALSEVEKTAPIRIRQDYLSGEELLERAMRLEETVENPALLDQAKTILALEAGRREGALAVDRLLDKHLSFERNNGCKPQDVSTLDASGFDYLIPGLLPKPWVLLVHGDGGTGKSALCMNICKHISQGIAFNVHGGFVEVPKGKCLWLNGDQSVKNIRRAFNLIGVESGVDVITEWDMQWYRRFCKIQEKNMYDFIVIDSLDGCNDSNPYEENRREYALPIKRLSRRNGHDFPACSIAIIHHNNKTGGFRGTSAIRGAVDETWNMEKIAVKELAELGLPMNSRLITAQKSRDDREGQKMVFTLRSDYTYQVGPMPEYETRIKSNGPNDFMLDVLKLMRAQKRPWSAPELLETSEVGGDHRKRAVRYALQRLEAQKLIERCDAPEGMTFSGRPPAFYVAVGKDVPVPFSKKGSLAQGDTKKSMSKDQTSSAGTDLIDKVVCQKSGFVKRSSPGALQAEPAAKDGGTFDKRELLTKPFVNETPCAATEEPFSGDFDGIRAKSPRLSADEAWKAWN